MGMCLMGSKNRKRAREIPCRPLGGHRTLVSASILFSLMPEEIIELAGVFSFNTESFMAGQTPKMHSWRCPLPHALEETTSLFFLLVRLLLRSISVATPCPLQPVIVSCLIFCPSASWASPRSSFSWQILPVANPCSLTYSHLPKIADCYLLIHGGGACSRIWGRFFGLTSPLGNRIFLGNLKENMPDWRVWFCEWS